jgi:hypothetical protein
MDIPAILESKFAGSQWTLNANSYDELNWLSEEPKPTKSQLEKLWESVKTELENKQIAKDEVRASALAKLAALGLTAEEIASL